MDEHSLDKEALVKAVAAHEATGSVESAVEAYLDVTGEKALVAMEELREFVEAMDEGRVSAADFTEWTAARMRHNDR